MTAKPPPLATNSCAETHIQPRPSLRRFPTLPLQCSPLTKRSSHPLMQFSPSSFLYFFVLSFWSLFPLGCHPHGSIPSPAYSLPPEIIPPWAHVPFCNLSFCSYFPLTVLSFFGILFQADLSYLLPPPARSLPPPRPSLPAVTYPTHPSLPSSDSQCLMSRFLLTSSFFTSLFFLRPTPPQPLIPHLLVSTPCFSAHFPACPPPPHFYLASHLFHFFPPRPPKPKSVPPIQSYNALSSIESRASQSDKW